MSCTRVKICGITSREDAQHAVDAGADALGFVFYPKSLRFIEPRRVAGIVEGLPPFVTAVGVFVNETAARVAAMVSESGVQVIQLSGDEPPEICRALSTPVIRALRVGPDFRADEIERWPSAAIHLDTAKAGSYGGTGRTFDWTVAREAARHRRIILAGGLTPENVGEAIRTVGPYAVDTSSGVERSPGKKDPAKVEAFISAAKKTGESR